MNFRLPRKARVKASGVPQTLEHDCDYITSVATPPLLTWFDVMGYTVMLEAEMTSGRHQTERSSHTEVVLRERL